MIPFSILLNPIRAAAPAAGMLYFLVRVQAPNRPAAQHAAPARRPFRLAVVIDRSGSMSGNRCTKPSAVLTSSCDSACV